MRSGKNQQEKMSSKPLGFYRNVGQSYVNLHVFGQGQELADIMYACIILHNMIVEDERGSYGIPDDNTYEQGQFSAQITGLDQGPIYGFAEVLQKNRDIRDRATHRRLKQDLIEHMWQRFGSQQQD